MLAFEDTVDGKTDPPMVLAIIRYHSIGEVPGWVEMIPTSPPELPNPSGPRGKCEQVMFKQEL